MNLPRQLLVRLSIAAAALFALPAMAQSAANGQSLYDTYCRVCHGFPPAGGPERANGDPAVISAAINGKVPTMGFLRDLVSAADIADIAAYLRSLEGGPQQPAAPAFDYTDLWWDPGESGWGLNLIQHPSNIVFAVMYTYDANGKATWFVLPSGTWSTSTVYSGPLYRVSGPPYTRVPFDAASVRVQQVGIGTLSFSGRDNGTFTFVVDNRQVSKTIARQPF